MSRSRLLPDNFTLILIAVVALASLLPCSGQAAVVFGWITNLSIALLFFLHGAKLSREAIVAGATHWRLHLLILGTTFVFYPLLGVALKPLLSPLMAPELYLGVLYLCALPSTVQSSIAMVSLGRGNVPAAICSASASSLIGIFVTPILVGLLLNMHGEGGSTLDAIWKIVLQLLVPFAAGQLLRPWIGGWVDRNKSWLKYVDQSSILLVIYTAFSAAVIEGLWHQVPLPSLALLVAINGLLLTIGLVVTMQMARRLKLAKEDEITLVFCGSKKSLASGVPMAQVLFSGGTLGAILLPIMLYHQMQLMVCSVMAQRYARRVEQQPKGQ
jgi:sodium/bile acid cotransporter 7